MVSIEISKRGKAAFCKKLRLRKVSWFGSVPRDDLPPDSNVDALVVFEEGHAPGLITPSGMELKFGKILGRKADLGTPEDLMAYFHYEVMRSAEAQYAA